MKYIINAKDYKKQPEGCLFYKLPTHCQVVHLYINIAYQRRALRETS